MQGRTVPRVALEKESDFFWGNHTKQPMRRGNWKARRRNYAEKRSLFGMRGCMRLGGECETQVVGLALGFLGCKSFWVKEQVVITARYLTPSPLLSPGDPQQI